MAPAFNLIQALRQRQADRSEISSNPGVAYMQTAARAPSSGFSTMNFSGGSFSPQILALRRATQQQVDAYKAPQAAQASRPAAPANTESSNSGGDNSGGSESSPASIGMDTYGSNNSLSNGLVGEMLGLSSQPSTGVAVDNVGTYAGQPDFGFGSSMTGVGNPGEADMGGFTSSDTGLGNPGESYGGGGDFGGWAKGGMVTRNRLKGPNPKGPDDGYGALDAGEFVLTEDAVKKLGPIGLEVLRRLNKADKK